MDSKMRVAKTLTKFMVLEGNRHRITHAWKEFPFLVAGLESMRGRELERVKRRFLLAARPVGVKGRKDLRAFFLLVLDLWEWKGESSWLF